MSSAVLADLPPAPQPAVRSDAILCVDDDLNILEALRRQFHKAFRIETALGPERGLAAISEKGPFAVVISDLRMPGMNGIQFLANVRALAPETVRVMLTGQADLADAIAAVNQDAIFRFLLKPSSATILSKVIESALEQHRLLIAERELTQQTLLGCVGVLTEVLSIVEPVAFSRTNRILRYVRQLAGLLKVKDAWQLEAAAMLSQIGWITVPSEIAAKLASNEPLSAQESSRYRGQPAAAARLIERIPRLEPVARIIEGQLGPPDGAPESAASISLPASILQAALDFDGLRCRGLSHGATLGQMRVKTHCYSPELLSALTSIDEIEAAEQIRPVRLDRLAPGMVLQQDVCARNGMCLIGKGQEITLALLQRLRGFSHVLDSGVTVSVRIPHA